MIAIVRGAAIFLLATSASAQTTNCQWVGNVWTCNQRPGVNWGLGQQQSDPQTRLAIPFEQQMQEEANASQRAAQTAGQQAAWAHLADLIRQHKCGEAIDFAIRQGGTDAGLRAKSLCE